MAHAASPIAKTARRDDTCKWGWEELPYDVLAQLARVVVSAKDIASLRGVCCAWREFFGCAWLQGQSGAGGSDPLPPCKCCHRVPHQALRGRLRAWHSCNSAERLRRKDARRNAGHPGTRMQIARQRIEAEKRIASSFRATYGIDDAHVPADLVALCAATRRVKVRLSASEESWQPRCPAWTRQVMDMRSDVARGALTLLSQPRALEIQGTEPGPPPTLCYDPRLCAK